MEEPQRCGVVCRQAMIIAWYLVHTRHFEIANDSTAVEYPEYMPLSMSAIVLFDHTGRRRAGLVDVGSAMRVASLHKPAIPVCSAFVTARQTTLVQEGSVVRAITRLDELCREVRILALASFALPCSHFSTTRRKIPTIDDNRWNIECTLWCSYGFFRVFCRALLGGVPGL